MARKIFVSYKYSDNNVAPLNQSAGTTARDYVNILEELFEDDQIYKGEKDHEDLGNLDEETIKSRLKDRMFDSSVTIVLISKNMREAIPDKEQWIPWEISYSLKEQTREDNRSLTNAMLAVALPDEYGRYDYIVTSCPYCPTRVWMPSRLFSILGRNMFNRKQSKAIDCTSGRHQRYRDNDHSYIYPVIWEEFWPKRNWHIEHAISIRDNIDYYNVEKLI